MVFYNDRSAEIEIDETFQKLWRSIPVASIDEEKIQDYLDKQGITSVDDPGIRKVQSLCIWLRQVMVRSENLKGLEMRKRQIRTIIVQF